jgi:hypothetical protein
MDGMRDYVGQETRDRDAFEAAYGASPGFDGDDTPPPVLETDERRMQVRAYNFWASMLGTAVPAGKAAARRPLARLCRSFGAAPFRCRAR